MSSDDDSSKVVELEAGLSKRFYETVLFLHCLKEVMVKAESVKEPEADLESNTGRSPRDSFRCFVNKLGQICDSGIRGKTVTAFAVLQPNQIQYRFASNQRTSKELKDVKTFIAAILDVLGSTHDDQLNGVFGTILERVLAFNRTAIEQYVKNLTRGETLDFCEKRCKEEDTAEAQQAACDINSLRRFVLPEEEPSPENLEKFVTQSRELLETISQLHSSSFEGFLRNKARADRDPCIKTHWSELRHAFGRLHSYTVAVRVLISMRRRRRELFEDFQIIPVPSSNRIGCPTVRRSVDGIIQRFPKEMKPQMLQACNACLPQEQRKVLEKKIKANANGKCNPYVHAELVVLDSILAEEQREGTTLRFFAEADYDRYIGCSKPTCRLCQLYIDNHPSGVEFRGGHGNLYPDWRAPDIFKDGVNVGKATRIRKDIHNKMVDALRQRIQMTFADKAVERNHHDSNTTPTSSMGTRSSTCNPYLAVQAATDGMDNISTTGAMDDSDDMATTLGRLTIAGDSDRSGSSTSISRSSQDTSPVPDSNAGSPNGLPKKAFIDRRQRPPIIEEDE